MQAYVYCQLIFEIYGEEKVLTHWQCHVTNITIFNHWQIEWDFISFAIKYLKRKESKQYCCVNFRYNVATQPDTILLTWPEPNISHGTIWLGALVWDDYYEVRQTDQRVCKWRWANNILVELVCSCHLCSCYTSLHHCSVHVCRSWTVSGNWNIPLARPSE